MLELDSVSLPFIRQNLEHLPTMKRLLDQGQLVETGSTADIASASVWPTFASGKQPGEHGHYFPFQWHPEAMKFYRPYRKAWNGRLDYDPFWYDLARGGMNCLVLDAVQSVPHAPPSCLEINDWSAQSSGHVLTSDQAVLDELKKRFGKRPIGIEVPVQKSRKLSSALQTRLLDSLKLKSDAIIWLGQAKDWQFFLASIQDVHRAGHNLWPADPEIGSDVEPDALLGIYQAMDHEVERILAALTDENTITILFTLNGMAPNRAQNHLLPQILKRLNSFYMTGKASPQESARRDGTMARLRDALPPFLQYATTQLLGETIQDWVVNREFTGGLDWSSTPSFPVPTGGEGLIRLNIEGRERSGMLSTTDGSCEKYVEWLKESLLDIRVAKTNEPLVRECVDVHDLYPGEFAHWLPDIAVQWAPERPATEIVSDRVGIIRNSLKTGRGGNHTAESFAVITANTDLPGTWDDLTHIRDYRDVITRLFNQN
jgi:predicted AlkP superfamily phosphohydrolase/phosphomutase